MDEILSDDDIASVKRLLTTPFLKKHEKEAWRKTINTIESLKAENVRLREALVSRTPLNGKCHPGPHVDTWVFDCEACATIAGIDAYTDICPYCYTPAIPTLQQALSTPLDKTT